MELFLTVFIFMYLLSQFRFSNVDSKQRLYQTIVCLVPLILLQALRSPTVGHDILGDNEYVLGYYRMFYVAHDESIKTLMTSGYHMEIGWLAFCKFISLIANDFQFFLLVDSIIQIAIIGFVFFKLSKDIPLSFLTFATLGLYVFGFSGLRQALAISITFLAAFYLLEEKKYHFLVLTIIASLIHSSAIIFLISYPLSRLNFTRHNGTRFLIIYLLCIPFLTSLIAFFSGFLFGNKYENYLDGGGAISMFLVFTFIYVVFLCKVKDESIYTRFLRLMIFATVVGQSFGIVSASNMTRIGYYFMIFLPLAIPYIIGNIKNQKLLSVLTFCILIAFFYFKGDNASLRVFPYSFFWE